MVVPIPKEPEGKRNRNSCGRIPDDIGPNMPSICEVTLNYIITKLISNISITLITVHDPTAVLHQKPHDLRSVPAMTGVVVCQHLGTGTKKVHEIYGSCGALVQQ